jgi:hypothetical protein
MNAVKGKWCRQMVLPLATVLLAVGCLGRAC